MTAVPSAPLVADPLPPTFYPVSLNLVGRRCVVIGDDFEAVEKEEALRESGAEVVWIKDGRDVRDEDVRDAFLVISTPQSDELSARLRALADAHRFLLCAIDQPRFGFVAMAAIVKAGPARIAISTGGVAPRVGKKLRETLQAALDAKFARFLACLATQKLRNRSRFRDSSKARREAMIGAAQGFELDVSVRYPQWFEDELALTLPRVAGN